jgi:hypothetical protein
MDRTDRSVFMVEDLMMQTGLHWLGIGLEYAKMNGTSNLKLSASSCSGQQGCDNVRENVGS